MDCAAHGVPAPTVTWHSEHDDLIDNSNSNNNNNEPLVMVLPHNGSLHFRPFHAREFRPQVHAAAYWCRAQSQSGAIVSPRVKVRAGEFNQVTGQSFPGLLGTKF